MGGLLRENTERNFEKAVSNIITKTEDIYEKKKGYRGNFGNGKTDR